jgi:hypothetical protein
MSAVRHFVKWKSAYREMHTCDLFYESNCLELTDEQTFTASRPLFRYPYLYICHDHSITIIDVRDNKVVHNFTTKEFGVPIPPMKHSDHVTMSPANTQWVTIGTCSGDVYILDMTERKIHFHKRYRQLLRHDDEEELPLYSIYMELDMLFVFIEAYSGVAAYEGAERPADYIDVYACDSSTWMHMSKFEIQDGYKYNGGGVDYLSQLLPNGSILLMPHIWRYAEPEDNGTLWYLIVLPGSRRIEDLGCHVVSDFRFAYFGKHGTVYAVAPKTHLTVVRPQRSPTNTREAFEEPQRCPITQCSQITETPWNQPNGIMFANGWPGVSIAKPTSRQTSSDCVELQASDPKLYNFKDIRRITLPNANHLRFWAVSGLRRISIIKHSEWELHLETYRY